MWFSGLLKPLQIFMINLLNIRIHTEIFLFIYTCYFASDKQNMQANQGSSKIQSGLYAQSLDDPQ